jgi:hypothetical protein
MVERLANRLRSDRPGLDGGPQAGAFERAAARKRPAGTLAGTPMAMRRTSAQRDRASPRGATVASRGTMTTSELAAKSARVAAATSWRRAAWSIVSTSALANTSTGAP